MEKTSDWMKDLGKNGVRFWEELFRDTPYALIGDNGVFKLVKD